ncbi:MAG: hypothetical protein QM473_20975 [Acidobacteriota bacterium]|nr:hypothetical protein [Acidobacteriota bacterium]
MPRWLVLVDGDAGLLDRLAALFVSPELHVRESDDGYGFHAQDLDAIDSPGAVLEAAGKHIILLNVYAKHMDSHAQQIRHRGLVELAGCTTRHHVVVLCDSLSIKATMPMVEAPTDPVLNADIASRMARLVTQDEPLQKVLRLWIAYRDHLNHPEPWVALRRIVEAVERDLGKSADDMGWVPQNERDRFGANANHPLLTGDKAAHSSSHGKPPKQTAMAVSSATDFVGHIIDRYMLWKAST